MSIPQPRTRTRLAPTERAAQIRAAAAALAREQGLAALTLRAIAQRAGVAPGLVAHYATSMDDLVAAVFVELTGAELGDVRTRVEASRGPAAQLATLFETVLGHDHEDITLVWVDAWSLGRGNAALAAAIDEQMDAWRAFLADVVREGRHAGLFAVDDPDAAAWQILAMIDGVSAHALVAGADPAPFAARLAQACEALVGAAPGTVARPG